MDDGAKVQIGEGVVWMVDGKRISESDGVDHRQVRLQEGGHEPALYDVAGVGRASLLGVFEPPSHMLRQEMPLREVPDAPRVQAFLLEHVPSAGVGERDGRPPPVGPAAHEGQCPDAL